MPTLPVKLRNATGLEYKIEAIVDTGFSSSLSIPPYVAAILQLPIDSSGKIFFANGSSRNYDSYKVQIEWAGHYIDVVASAMGNIPLIGMRLLRGHQLRIDVEPLGKLEIEPLPVSPRP